MFCLIFFSHMTKAEVATPDSYFFTAAVAGRGLRRNAGGALDERVMVGWWVGFDDARAAMKPEPGAYWWTTPWSSLKSPFSVFNRLAELGLSLLPDLKSILGSNTKWLKVSSGYSCGWFWRFHEFWGRTKCPKALKLEHNLLRNGKVQDTHFNHT